MPDDVKTTGADDGSGRLRRAPVQERSRATVERILAATQELIDTEGVDAATTRAIAERAGVAGPSLYRFFADRDEILDQLLERHLAELFVAMTELEAGWQPASLDDFIDAELDAYVAFYEARPSAVRLWFEGRVSATVVAKVREFNRATAEHMHAQLAGAGLEPPDLLVVTVFLELGDRVLDLAFRNGPPADRAVLDLGRTALHAYLDRVLLEKDGSP